MPLFCIVAAKSFKYFNSVLAYCIMVIAMKIVQIVALSLFGHVGACTMLPLYRVPVIVYLIIIFFCLFIDAWILKRIRRVDR